MTRRELEKYLQEVEPDEDIEFRVVGETEAEVEAERAGVWYMPVEIDMVADINDITIKDGKAVMTLWV